MPLSTTGLLGKGHAWSAEAVAPLFLKVMKDRRGLTGEQQAQRPGGSYTELKVSVGEKKQN